MTTATFRTCEGRRRPGGHVDKPKRHLHVADLTCLHCHEKDAELERKAEIIEMLQRELNESMKKEHGALAAAQAAGNALLAAKGQITKDHKKSVKAEQVKAIVDHWRYHRPRTSPVFGEPGTKTFQIIEKALVLMEKDPQGPVKACMEAIDGLHLAPWQRYDRWYAKRIDDKCSLRNGLEYALGDEQRIERCREVLRKVRGGGAARAWRVYMALGETERAWADEVLDLLREQPAPRERFAYVDGIRTRVDA
jgi:hypothetical protein